MFKKIHSDRDPGVTLPGELKKEFAVYLAKTGAAAKLLSSRYPKVIFGLMSASLLVSIGLTMTIGNFHPAPLKKRTQTVWKPFHGRSVSAHAWIALKEAIRLKQQVDSIMHKRDLSNADSVLMIKDLKQLELIYNLDGSH